METNSGSCVSCGWVCKRPISWMLNSPSRTATHMDNTNRWRGPPGQLTRREETAFRPGPAPVSTNTLRAIRSQHSQRFSSRAQTSRPASLAAWGFTDPASHLDALIRYTLLFTLHITLHITALVMARSPSDKSSRGFDWDRAQTRAALVALSEQL